MIKRLIFDIDGTLVAGVDFRPAQEEMLKRAKIYSKENLSKLVMAIETYEDNFDCYSKINFIKHINSFLDINLEEKYSEEIIEICKDIMIDKNDRIVNLLQELSSKYEMVILSNFFEEVQRSRLTKMGINQFFTEYYGEKLIKPNRQVYIDACRGHNPNECVMIGDNFRLDIKPARELGINTIYINPKEEQVEFPDVISIKKIEDLSDEIIFNMNKQKVIV